MGQYITRKFIYQNNYKETKKTKIRTRKTFDDAADPCASDRERPRGTISIAGVISTGVISVVGVKASFI